MPAAAVKGSSPLSSSSRNTGLKSTGVPGLWSRPPRWTCRPLPPALIRFSHFLAEPGGNTCTRKTTRRGYLPARGGSVKVRTKRREKRTKLLLSAFGNIYPPFIVTPLSRNVRYIPRICTAAALSETTPRKAERNLCPFSRSRSGSWGKKTACAQA